jgi:hypothetical protein
MKLLSISFLSLLLTINIYAQSDFDGNTVKWKPKFDQTAGFGSSVNGGVFTIDPENTSLPVAYKALWGMGNHNFNLFFRIKADQPISGNEYPQFAIIVNDQDQAVCHESGYLNGLIDGVKDGRYFGAEFNTNAKLFGGNWNWLTDATVPYDDNIHSSTFFSDGQQLEFKLSGGSYSEAYCILRKTSPMTGQLELYRDATYSDPIDTLKSVNLYQHNIGRNSMDAVDAWRDWCNEVVRTWDAGFVEVFSSGTGTKATIDQIRGEIIPPIPTVTGKNLQWSEEIDYERGYALYDSINGIWSIRPDLEAYGFNYIHPFPVGYNSFEFGYTMRRGTQGRFPTAVVCVTSLIPEEQAGQPLLSYNGVGFGDSPGQASWIGVQFTGSKFNFYGRMYEEPDNPYNPHPRPLYDYHNIDLANSNLDAVFVVLRRVTPNYVTFGIYKDSLYTDPVAELEANLIGRAKGSTFTPSFGLSRMGEEVYQSTWHRYGDGGYYNINKIVDTSPQKAFVSDEIRDRVQQRYGEYLNQLQIQSLMMTFDIMGGGDDGSIENLFAREIAPTGQEYKEWTGPTRVINQNNVVKPALYKLSQNYPNPFNPNTVIEYSLSQKTKVNITIYNLLGTAVTTLIDQQQETGQYSRTWDGTDGRGNLVTAGIYFYTMKAGNKKITRKMVFTK